MRSWNALYEVHTANPGRREEKGQLILNPFGAKTPNGHLSTSAGQARAEIRDRVTAVVAYQLIALFVIGKANRAVLTLRDPGTLLALDVWRKTPSILKKDYLFVQIKSLFDGINKLGRRTISSISSCVPSMCQQYGSRAIQSPCIFSK